MGSMKRDHGSIGDLFTSLGTAPPILDERFAELKQQLRPDRERLAAAWQRLRAAISAEVAELKAQGSSAIPTVPFADIMANGGFLPDEVAERVRRRGCVVVRGTIEREAAEEMRRGIEEYIASNREHLAGFPKDNPQVWECYWSKPQGQMRQHPNMLLTQTALNRLWHCRTIEGQGGQKRVDVHRPLTYSERLRIRRAGDKSFTLGPHIDGGSVERWEDEEYRLVYKDILNCEWEKWDAWDATHRAEARCDMYQLGVGACSLFRTFQGWMALSNSGSGSGALLVAPIVREATAYIILRPFLEDVSAASFCGANPGKTQDLFSEFHAEVIEALVPMPDVRPGDTVWWHCDLIHAVEGENASTEDAAAFYIPALPLCRKNAEYLRRQAERFLKGRTPPDFPANDSEVACVGRCTPQDLTESGRAAMGLAQFPEAAMDGEASDEFAATRRLREECRDLWATTLADNSSTAKRRSIDACAP